MIKVLGKIGNITLKLCRNAKVLVSPERGGGCALNFSARIAL